MASFLSSLAALDRYRPSKPTFTVPLPRRDALTSEGHMSDPPWREQRPNRPYGGEPGARPRGRDPGPPAAGGPRAVVPPGASTLGGSRGVVPPGASKSPPRAPAAGTRVPPGGRGPAG